MKATPRFVYVGIDQNGEPVLMVSEDKLNPVGPRLKKGNDFPKAVYDFYQIDHSVMRAAIKSMEAFLEGKEFVSEKLEFGQPLKRK